MITINGGKIDSWLIYCSVYRLCLLTTYIVSACMAIATWHVSTLSVFLALCEENTLVTNGFPSLKNVELWLSLLLALAWSNLSNKQSSCGYFEMPWPSYDVRHCNDAVESLGYQIAVTNGNISCYSSIEEQFSSCPRQVKQYFDLFWSSRACDDYVIWSLARRRSVHLDLGQPALWCSFL